MPASSTPARMPAAMKSARTLPLRIAALASVAALAACATDKPTKGSWSCGIPGTGSCSTIDEIDRGVAGGTALPARSTSGPIIDGAQPARWWTVANHTAAPSAAGPLRETDQVMRVVIAPWVDAVGDYHGKGEVFSIMRRGAWWLTAPGQAQPNRTVIAATPAPAPRKATAKAQPAPAAAPVAAAPSRPVAAAPAPVVVAAAPAAVAN